ncbi:MAG: twin transmembrane helix small protein [Beijerinckiaceae bacterium]|nr:twin transmembrane helix small protein [Beijerinckiaceae bacterium]
MPDVFKWIIPIAMGAVVIVLGFGLANMMRGGSANTSQMLMRWRVILQFGAVIIMMIVLFIKSRS